LNKNLQFTDSFWIYRAPEIIIFLIILTLNIAFFILNSPEILADVNNLFNSQLFPAIPIGAIVFYIFFIIDHRYSIIMNKENNIFLVVEKMLFFDKYKIKTKMELDKILSANIMTNRELGSRGHVSITYSVVIKTLHLGTVKVSDYSSSNYNKWFIIVQRINNFFNSGETYLQINENPFVFRLFSVLPLIACFQMIADSWK